MRGGKRASDADEFLRGTAIVEGCWQTAFDGMRYRKIRIFHGYFIEKEKKKTMYRSCELFAGSAENRLGGDLIKKIIFPAVALEIKFSEILYEKNI